MSNLNESSQTGYTIHQAPKTRRISWLCNWRPLLTSTGIQPPQTSLPWQIPWTQSPSKNSREETYREKRKCIICFAAAAQEKDTTFTRLHIIDFTRKFCALLYYDHLTKNNWINEKFPHITSLLYVCSRTYLPKCHNWIPICPHV